MKPQQIKDPHDHFFKESMERKPIAYALLQKFFENPLPIEFTFRSLHIVKDIWIDTELIKHEADIVYVTKVKNSSQKSTFYLSIRVEIIDVSNISVDFHLNSISANEPEIEYSFFRSLVIG